MKVRTGNRQQYQLPGSSNNGMLEIITSSLDYPPPSRWQWVGMVIAGISILSATNILVYGVGMLANLHGPVGFYPSIVIGMLLTALLKWYYDKHGRTPGMRIGKLVSLITGFRAVFTPLALPCVVLYLIGATFSPIFVGRI